MFICLQFQFIVYSLGRYIEPPSFQFIRFLPVLILTIDLQMFLMEQEINRASEIFFCLTSHSQLYQCACIFSKKKRLQFQTTLHQSIFRSKFQKFEFCCRLCEYTNSEYSRQHFSKRKYRHTIIMTIYKNGKFAWKICSLSSENSSPSSTPISILM